MLSCTVRPRSGRRRAGGIVRAVRSLTGLVIVTLIGSAGFVGRPTASGRTVTVRRGDTLSAIAARAGTTVSAVAALNGIRDPDHVVIGTVLKLPSGGAAPAGAATTYVVRPGDTASSIAGRFGTTVAALAAANRIKNP